MSEVLGFSEQVAPEDAAAAGLPVAAPANEQAKLFDDSVAFAPEPTQPEHGDVALQTLLGDTEAFAPVEHTGQYGLMEVGDLIASHDADLNPRQPQGPTDARHRDRVSSEQQVQQMVRDFDPTLLGPSGDADTGAPVVDPSGVVVAGNARVVVLQRIYRADGQKAADYRDYLVAALPDLNLNPDVLSVMDKPALVRVVNMAP